MTLARDDLDQKINGMLQEEWSPRVIARRLFLFDFAQVFRGREDLGFEILDQVRDHFKVPFSAVRIVGSAQLGYTYIKGRDFTPKISDLDIGIISSRLFQIYSEFVYMTTRRYTVQTAFPLVEGINAVRRFRDSLSNGMFRPDLMPNSKQRDDWFDFFDTLSDKYKELFKSINAGIYLSEPFFEMKNSTVVDEFRKASK